MFVIEDEWHAEHIANYETREGALAELRRLAGTPWNMAPNRCPCTSWRTCGRRYHIVEYDTSPEPWRRLSDAKLLDVSAKGPDWLSEA